MNNAQALAIREFIVQRSEELGFQKAGFAAPARLDAESSNLDRYLDEGRHGSMLWLRNRREERSDPRTYYPPAATLVSLAMNYYTGPAGQQPGAPRWSNYAWGDDYHRLIKKRLKQLLSDLTDRWPDIDGLAAVDTAPIMEKSWAQRAGLGWIGKHTNLISRDFGSWLFLGQLLLNVQLPPDSPFAGDLCGSCTACITACPTGAITAPYELDARRCISYLTIEQRGEFTAAEEAGLSGWVYGCDICQEVCPWNIRFARETHAPAFQPREFIAGFSRTQWTGLTEEQWDLMLRGSAARRAGFAGMLRNIRAWAKQLT